MKYEEKLLAILKEASISTIGEAEEFLKCNLEMLHETGELSLGNDKDLSGKPLELRVKELFKKAGFNINNGRNGYEDFTITPDDNFSIQDSIVIEVKSSKNVSPKLSDLRQLDDWVFNLSGEENARKHGLGSSEQFTWSGGMTKHPTPHKGLFIFNGPIGHDFDKRLSKFIHPSQIDFLNKRNFCAISLNKLVNLLSGDKESAWILLHETIGEFN